MYLILECVSLPHIYILYIALVQHAYIGKGWGWGWGAKGEVYPGQSQFVSPKKLYVTPLLPVLYFALEAISYSCSLLIGTYVYCISFMCFFSVN